MGEVNTCNVKMKEMDEREIANDKRGLVRDKAVDRSKGKTEAMVWLEKEVFQSLSQWRNLGRYEAKQKRRTLSND